MTGPKLNEGALLIPDGQPTVKATAKYLRGSASKAREVLDLIRGLDVRRADEVLRFTTRDVARDIRKVLASAVANAVHNEAQDADELYVLAAFADEGPTLRRFRPRARGRATRIRKRTCHITVVVTRLSDDRLEVLQARQQASSPAARRRAGTSVQSRRDRVERSRTRAQGLREGAADTGADTETPAADEGAVDATEVVAEEAAEIEDATIEEATIEVEETAVEETAAEEPTPEEYSADLKTFADAVAGPDADADTTADAEAESIEPAEELPTGAVAAPDDGSIPEGYEIKGNRNSMKYHVPGGRYYDITIAEVFFDTPEHAEAAGFEAPAADVDTEDNS